VRRGAVRAASQMVEPWVITQAEIDRLMQDRVKRYGDVMPKGALTALMLEWKGGDCPLCGNPFMPKSVINRVVAKDKDTGEVLRDEEDKEIILHEFANFTMYVPGCRCFKRCTKAGIMMPEWVQGRTGGYADHRKMVVGKIPGCGAWMVAERLLQGEGIDQKQCLSCGGIIL